MPIAVPGRPAELSGASTATERSSRAFALPRGLGGTAGRIAALTVCQAALMVGFGRLITGPAKHVWPMTVEDHVDEGFEHLRTHALTDVSYIGSEAGNTLTVIVITLLACVGLVLIPRLPMWRQASFLAVAVSLQALVFLVITLLVDRQRPHVHRLDASPPTSSYTSGHTGAATALYAGLAWLVLSKVRGPWRRIVAGILFLLPLFVAMSRLYRGMHHPTDVLGGLANGGLSLAITGSALFARPLVTAPPADGTAVEAAPGTDAVDSGPREAVSADDAAAGDSERVPALPGPVTVVVNPTVTGERDRDALRRVLESHGHRTPTFVETTAEDPGGGQAAAALRDGARLVVACGGDGTVRAVAEALAGSGVPLVVVPSGTGNLLARNLGLPLAPTDALDAALRGTPHRLDLARAEGDDFERTHFAAMAGAGLDAAIMERTADGAKSVIGWPAYVVAALTSLNTPPMALTLRLDGAPALRREARMVLVGNVGTVQGGTTLLPAARPDDGRLDLMILDPRGPGGWARALTAVLRGGRRKQPAPAHVTDAEGRSVPVEYFTFREAELTFDTPQSREVDGDPVSRGTRLGVSVVPGALTVLLPPRRAE
ncbi:diacylglycerol kinase family protein [Streptomyces sp. NPDC090306]|uniref:diacylglycerol kinase family protein n=1 Tax=Streptomyces sp. NPDC090306 TaxID=3365961 RepID=UPI00382132FC